MALMLVLVTFPDDLTAKKMADEVLKNKLAGCILRSKVNSIYQWDGEKHDDEEVVLLLKTTEENVDALERFILSNHPYETPAIISLNARANDSYQQWLTSTMS